MYDAQMGRFLSPDNHIQEPFNPQNYNRYAYALNNPLMYTDWSGEYAEGSALVIAVIVIFGISAAVGGYALIKNYFYNHNASTPSQTVAPTPSNVSDNSQIASSASRPSRGSPGNDFGLPQLFNGFKHFAKEYIGGTVEGHKRFVKGAVEGITQGIPHLLGSSLLANSFVLNGDFREGFGIHRQNALNLRKGLISPITQVGDAFNYALEGNIFEAQANLTEAVDGIALTALSGGTAGAVGKGVSGLSRLGRGITKRLNNIKIPVYRVYGGASRINGFSWTPINPKLLPSRIFRKYAGLPNINWGTGYIKGQARIGDILRSRRALPLNRNPGGLPEFIINPNNVNIWKYMTRPGLYKSYWGF